MIPTKYIISTLLAAGFATATAAQTDTVPYGDQLLKAHYGYQETRDSYTGSQASVDANQIETWKGTGLKAAINGKLSGWYNGVIRGASSPYATDPLVVLDGIPMPFISIDDLDPTTVDNVTILKDAAAKALYGPEGAQGVMLITTKHGNNKALKVDISANFQFQKPTEKPEMLNSYGQALLRNQALINDGLEPRFSDEALAAFRDGTGTDNDWRDLYMKDIFLQKYNVQVGGGGDRVTFYVNAGFARESGRYNTEYEDKYNPSDFTNRFTVVSNLDVKITSWLRAFAHTNIGIKRVNATRKTGDIYKLIYTTPNWVEDGHLDNGSVITSVGYANPIYGALNYSGVNQMTRTDLAANLGLDFDLSFLTKGLSLKAIFGYSSIYNGIRGGSYDYERVIYNDKTGEYEQWGSQVNTPLSWAKGTTTNYFMDFQAMLNYSRVFGEDHSVDAFLHYKSEDYRGDTDKWYQYAFMLPANRIALAGEARYGFKQRYFVQFDFNHSGSEMMATGHQFHFSPTVSASWVASNESWLRNDVMTYLKFRASYGALYYDSLRAQDSRYLYNNVYRGGAGGIQGIFSGFGINNLRRGNPLIGWEKSKQQDYGIDFGFLDCIHMTLDYWRTNQDGVLVQSELAPTIGGVTSENRAFSNAGKILNQGIDLSLSYSKTLACGLGITAMGQMGWNKNEWKDAQELSYASAKYAYPYRKTGYSLGQSFGYMVDDSNGSPFYNSQEEIASSGLTYVGKQPRPGDLKFADLNKDGIIDEGDMAPMEGVQTHPNFEYGASVALDYKGFDLYLDFVGESGRSRLMNASVGVAEYVSGVTTDGVYMPLHQEAWTADRYAQGLPISYPALSTSASSSLQNNSYFISKMDYLRLHNLTIGYSLPANIVKAMGMTRLRVYVSAQNLATWDWQKFDGFAPEAGQIYDFVYRSFNVGLNINF